MFAPRLPGEPVSDVSGDSGNGRREKVRLSLDLTPELNERLQEIADMTGGTKSEVIRKALALMDVAVQAKETNARILITTKDETREIVGLF